MDSKWGNLPFCFDFFFFLRQSLPPENWDRGHRPQSCVRSGVFLIRRVGVNDPGDESHFLFPVVLGTGRKASRVSFFYLYKDLYLNIDYE